MELDTSTMTALWGAVILSGFYHGVNPGMGWPLAVSAGLMEGRNRAMAKAIGALAVGHLLAMLAILLPFSMMTALVNWQKEIRIGAGALVIAAGIYLLINRRHPRFLSRIHPTKLVLWSFLAAMAHGAGLMLVPIYLGICGVETADGGHDAARELMGQNIASAVFVALAHTLAMTIAGGVIAMAIYFYFGLKFLSRTWFNLDVLWASSLILVGCFGIYLAFEGH
ncbi:hypothetical protein SAMN04490248_10286 [Salinihabitans flavidus]|uniref:Uncharacterized protein n=1 Tax=Salinihabitans flavidus TaxID=569882 RepID=A0A1H8MHW9_9RHOB|nr:hypothetical protein [Salinihabitans flavidus]SEO16818.1 hypothetical protein SAMN04490248_10286 [Salinihabitans flavidus]